MTSADSPLRVALVYDMDACRGPTGVTRHALAQLERLAHAPAGEVRLTAVSGRIGEPDGLAFWESLDGLPRRELPLSTRDALRFWRYLPWPPLEFWTGPLDWAYCPAEYFVPTRRARLAVTSHDVLQDIRFSPPRRRFRLDLAFSRADLILSVSQFNTERLLEHYPECRGRVAYVPNAAEDLFFEPATESERASVREDLGLPPGLPYLLSVANFQPRKNLPRLVQAAARLAEIASGDLALVLVGTGSEDQERPIRAAITEAGPKARIVLPGYRQGKRLRACYAEAMALVFPSLCESFGIPAIEAMAQSCPVALADSTALPEIAGEAAWYFPPEDPDALTSTLRSLLDSPTERSRLVSLGLPLSSRFRWDASSRLLLSALRTGPS